LSNLKVNAVGWDTAPVYSPTNPKIKLTNAGWTGAIDAATSGGAFAVLNTCTSKTNGGSQCDTNWSAGLGEGQSASTGITLTYAGVQPLVTFDTNSFHMGFVYTDENTQWFSTNPNPNGGGCQSDFSGTNVLPNGGNWNTAGGPNAGNCYFQVWPSTSTEEIPEPGTLSLFGAGLIGLAVARRRRR
jgi:hypothetical protein